MNRFIPRFTFRPLILSAVCLTLLIALGWPLANLWASHGQTRDEKSAASTGETRQPAASTERQGTDILDKLIKTDNSERTIRDGEPILPSQIDESAQLLVPTITVTMTDAVFTDVDGDGRADPGDTLKYTVTINNAGTDATGVKFTDTLPTSLTLVGGSVNASPIALDDPGYTATGNVRSTQSASLLANDINLDAGTGDTLTASGPTTTTQNGNLTVNADGTFVYNPAPGFEGTDTFTYTVTDLSGATATATATINVSGMIWFVNAAAGAGGDGRLTSPFNCLSGAGCYSGSANDPNDNIFLYSGSYTGGITLKNGQKVIGQGTAAPLTGAGSATGITLAAGSDALPSTGGTRPAVTTAAAGTSAFTLGSGNTLRGFNIGNTTAADITGTSFGTLTALEMDLNGTGRPLALTTGTLAATFDTLTSTSSSGGPGVSLSGVGGTLTVTGAVSITGASTQGISISGSTLGATFGSTTVATSTTQGILIGTTTTGTIAFGNTTITGGTDGVSFQNNSSGSRTFGTLNVSGGSGTAFLSGAGGGNVTVSGAATLSSAGNAIDIASLTSGSTVTFSGAVSATRTAAGGQGVNLTTNTGSTISFNSLAITTNAGTGLNATGGGTVTVTNGTGAINSTPQAAAAIIANGVTLNANFSSIASSGGTNGVSLTSVSGTSNFGTGSLTGASGSEFLVSGGSPTVTYAGSITQNNAARVVDIQSTTGGTVTFNTGTVTGGASSTGVILNADNGNVSFANLNLGTSGSRMGSQALTITGGSGTKTLGALSIFTNNANGINASGGTGAISSTSGEVNTTGAAAINIAGTSAASRTPLNIQLTKVQSTGSATNGIIVQNTSSTGSPGGFRVLGNTAGICGGSVTNTTTPGTPATATAPNTGDCSGGTITASSDGIRLVSVENVSLTRMFITANGDSGIFGTEVNGFIIDASYVFNNGNVAGERGLKFRDVTNPSPGNLNGLIGSAQNGSFPTKFTNTTVRQNAEHNVEIVNRTGTLTDLLIDGCQFTDTKTHGSGIGADGFNVEMQNTSNATMRAQNSLFSNNSTQGAQVSATDSATLNFTLTSSTVTGNNEGFVCNNSFSADLICTVGGDTAAQGNTFATNTQGVLIASSASTCTSASSMTAKFKFNNVNSPATNTIHAVYAFIGGTNAPETFNFSNNTVVNNGAGHAIFIDDPDAVTSSPQVQVTANNNNVTNGPGNGGNGVLVQARKNVNACVLIQNNTGTVQAGLSVARVRTDDTGTMNLKQGVSGSTVPATVIANNNPGVTTSASISGGTMTVVANNACTTPAQRIIDGEGSPDEMATVGQSIPLAMVKSTEQVAAFDFLNRATAYFEGMQQPSNVPATSETTVAANASSVPQSSINVLALPLLQPEFVAAVFRNRDAHTNLLAQGQTNSRALNHAAGQEERRQISDGTTQDVDHSEPVDKSQSEMIQVRPGKKGESGRPDSGETITVGGVSGFALPATKTVTITFQAVIGNPLPALTQVSNQGTVSATGIADVLTDDPAVAGAANPTVRQVDSTTVAVTSNGNPSVTGQNVTFTATMTGVPSRASDPPGTVQFKADGNNIGAAVSVVVGTVGDNVSTAQVSTSSLSIGTHVITAEYSGGGSGATGYNANIGTLAGGQVVGKGNTTTAVTSTQNPSVFSQQVTFTATIAATAPATGTPSGTVSFTDGGNPIAGCTSVSISGGQAQCIVSNLSVGNHTIAASYGGDTSFNTSNANLTGNPQVVNKANSAVGVTSSQNASVFGQQVTFTAMVAASAPATGTPSGTVSFTDGGNPIAGCTSVALSGGQAQCIVSNLSVGNHTIAASYGGDASFNTSNANLTGNPQVVNKASASVGLTSNANPSVFGQSVSFTATIAAVAPGAGTPSGTVQFTDGGNPIAGCTSVAVAAGQAVCSASSLSVGNHTITASYTGDGNFNSSNGNLTGNPQVVNKADTSVGLTSGTNPSVFGQQVTFTATIAVTAPGAGTPSGTFSFTDGGNPIAGCTGVAIAAGQAQCQTSALSVGNHTIAASYGGDGNFNTSNGNLTGNPQVVNKASTSVGLTSNVNPSVFGQAVTFTATVSVTAPGAGSPSGTINFLDGGNPITGCQNVALQTGQAQCQPGSLSVGNHTITVAYSGDGSFNTSNGSLTGNPQVVNKANTSAGLTSSQNPAPLGTSITFTATIAVTAPGAGTPSGTVQFLDGGNPIAGCTSVAVNAGQAQCMTNALTVGNHTITAAYSGDASFNTSNASLTGNPQVITGPPALIPTAGLTRTQGSPASNSQIAMVSDDVASPGSITVTVQSAPTGITVSNIVNSNGTITADLAAGCGAATGNNTVVLKATDGKSLESTSNLVINVAANTAPTMGTYSNSTIVVSCKAVITPTAPPGDNGSVSSVMASASAGFTGTLAVDQTTGVVTITNSGPVSAGHTITVTATDNCGLTSNQQFTLTVVAPPTAPTEFDFDGDRKADVAVYRPGATVNDFSFWYILRSSDSTVQFVQFGHDTDIIVPGDYNGDGTTDVAVYRPSVNTWFTSQDPANNYGAFVWGQSGDIPMPGFYDADNKTDIAVWRPSDGKWYIAKSTGGTDIRSWGAMGDKPLTGDFDGDGKTDLAVWRPSDGNWYIQKSGGGTITQAWGLSTDLLVPADYDGDGKDDIAVFRPSTGFWYILNSSGGTRIEQWGQAGDRAAPADFDNDGKADLAVYRPSVGDWFIFSSCPCVLNAKHFGIGTDTPLPAAFTPPPGP